MASGERPPSEADESDRSRETDGSDAPRQTDSVDESVGVSLGESDRESVLSQFRHADRGPLMWVREMLSSALIVLAIGLVLFAISGVWPPMVAVESGSMEPNMEKGDLVFVTEPGRFAPDVASNGLGVVTYAEGRDGEYEGGEYRSFGSYGSVIVFHEPGSHGPPIIHRAHFYVEEGEDWVERADESHLRADSCEEVQHCPASHDGFITKGDNNPRYDQASGIAPVVRQEWVTGVARVRIPYLGWVRLIFTGVATSIPVAPETMLFAAGSSIVAVGTQSRHSL